MATSRQRKWNGSRFDGTTRTPQAWACPACRTHNPNRKTTCDVCGALQPETISTLYVPRALSHQEVRSVQTADYELP